VRHARAALGAVALLLIAPLLFAPTGDMASHAQTAPRPAAPAQPAPPPAPKPITAAILQGLDKITARVTPIKVPIGQTARFGTLEIQVRACNKRPPEEPPETAAYVEIREVKSGEEPTKVFGGWMFASSPALSTLEHAVYDVWVTDCQ
jgi:hypothetical protein